MVTDIYVSHYRYLNSKIYPHLRVNADVLEPWEQPVVPVHAQEPQAFPLAQELPVALAWLLVSASVGHQVLHVWAWGQA
jgi:hypothetical protein